MQKIHTQAELPKLDMFMLLMLIGSVEKYDSHLG